MSGEGILDAIIVGAGPAGSACAYTLAKEGKEVLLIERGDSPGCKNVTGGRLYAYSLEMLDKGMHEDATMALERKVTHEQIMLLAGDRAITIDYCDPSFYGEDGIPMSYTVLRANFDEWLAGKAEEMGAILACGIRVDGLVERDGRIIGVIAGEDEIYANVVIAADGVNSFMAQKAGLISEIMVQNVGVGLKEVIYLPPEVIEERFNISKDEGAARMLLGCTEGIHGGGFLYTNKESISLGCVLMPEEVAYKGKAAHEILQDLKMHPAIFSLIKDGQTIEYGAHLVPEMGYKGLPKMVYRDGFLVVGDAAGFVINTGYSIRGIDLAITSGIAAASAIIAANNVPAIGPLYIKKLHELGLIPAMKTADGFVDILGVPWLYDRLPNIANGIFGSLFSVSDEVPEKIRKNVMRLIKENGLSLWQVIQLGIKGVKSL